MAWLGWVPRLLTPAVLKWVFGGVTLIALVGGVAHYKGAVAKAARLTLELGATQQRLQAQADVINTLRGDILRTEQALSHQRQQHERLGKVADDLLKQVQEDASEDVQTWLDGRVPAGVADRLRQYAPPDPAR